MKSWQKDQDLGIQGLNFLTREKIGVDFNNRLVREMILYGIALD